MLLTGCAGAGRSTEENRDVTLVIIGKKYIFIVINKVLSILLVTVVLNQKRYGLF